jgi:hypothetical protein
MVSRRKREHRPNAVQELLELRQRISGEEVTPELRKKAMAEVKAIRAQAKSQMMEEPGQQPTQADFDQKDDLAHEVTHKLEAADLLAIANSKLMRESRGSRKGS